MNRRTVLRAAGAMIPMAAGLSQVFAESSVPPVSGETPLWKLAANHGVQVGAALNTWIFNDPISRAVFQREFSAAVCEGAMKVGAIAPDALKLNFANPDAYVQVVQQMGKRLRGHTLLWHWRVPPWLAAASASRDSGPIRYYVEQMVSHFADSVFEWDVANELLSNTPAEYLRNSPLTPDGRLGLIVDAYKVARAAAPSVRLALNEYFLSLAPTDALGKARNFTRLVRELEDQGAEIDVIGLQAHLHIENNYTVSDYTRVLDELKKLNKPVVVTEYDLTDRFSSPSPAIEDQRAADELGNLLAALNNTFGKVSFYSWGILDRFSWINNPQYSKSTLFQRPLLFDGDGNSKAPLQVLRNYYSGR